MGLLTKDISLRMIMENFCFGGNETHLGSESPEVFGHLQVLLNIKN